MNPPAAIIYVNDNISDSVKEKLVRQLFIDDVQTSGEFDGYVDGYSDGYYDGYVVPISYPLYLKSKGLRVMVLRNDFPSRGTNPDWLDADIVIFVKNGLAAIEYNRFGPPHPQMSVALITWFKLGVLPFKIIKKG